MSQPRNRPNSASPSNQAADTAAISFIADMANEVDRRLLGNSIGCDAYSAAMSQFLGIESADPEKQKGITVTVR